MVYHNLKALIKAIRACKTIADERDLIKKESAAIRTAFKEEDTYTRYHNVAKLLYIHMLGYPAHFGQIECLKLVASPRFADKRLGYLGIMLLLDEKQEVLTLVTNSLKNDMNHSNMYAVGLGLCAFANIASEEMSRDLCNEVEKLLGSSNTYIRKKAALCALRIVRKVPDLIDHIAPKAKQLLSDRNHGVLLSGITLIIEMCQADPACCDEFRNAVPLLVRHLKSLVTTGYSPEHDVSGITDPFLQTKILRLLRLTGKGDAKASETMNDILAQVATNTDSSKNVGNSILYETVLTVLDIEADSGLRVMAINILGKFLSNRDNNIRYVALNTLNKVVSIDTNAVQRHRNTILDCLRDGDISIRRRALELSYALINESNVRVLIRELLAFLEVADDEFKLGITTQISLAAERFAPNKRWHIDTVLRTLTLAGNYVREEILSSFIRLVAHTPELQSYTASKLFTALQADVSQESLTLAAVWLIGEYSEILMESGIVHEESPKSVSDTDILDLFNLVLNSPYANPLTRQFVLTSVTKIDSRPATTAASRQRILMMLSQFSTTPELEIQQRAVEFASLLSQSKDVVEGVLERMPAPELKATVLGTVVENKPVGSTRTDKDTSLLDLSEDAQSPSVPQAQNAQNLLADIFGSVPAASSGAGAGQGPAPVPSRQKAVDDILGLFDSTPSAPSPAPAAGGLAGLSLGGAVASPPPQAPARAPTAPAAPAAAAAPAYTAYDKNGLKIAFTPQVSAAHPGMVAVITRFTTTSSEPVTGLNFQAAVPKTMQLQMMPISSSSVNPGAVETQQLRIKAPVGAQLRLRLRIQYQLGAQTVTEQVDFAGFPQGLTAGGQ
ncbi:Adaptor protein complex AP-1 gamma subunit [Exidia glandulosa HHB12029]|uniref:AP-1 complex subunit gamma n=1 Tax=Exidia glandulosa HHB12029 TaxID=1314781 RepID=A0A165MZI7_EXIGL|nr:Adaptor protein complex AP-1 gamma subunit [Exidia glandulosa HHB12029]